MFLHLSRRGRFIARIVLYGVVLLLAALPVCAQSTVSGPHVTVSLVSEFASLHPGYSAWVGLHFQLEKRWHVYWINPGDSGEPPKVEWQLPPGFKAGDLQFPFPHRLPLQTLMNFGYEDDVLYMAQILVPATNRQPIAKLTANVRWMVCKDTCIPGKGTLGISLPVAATAPQPSVRQALFKDTLARIPRKLDPGWRHDATLTGDTITLAISFLMLPTPPPKTAEFFPLDDLVIENAAPQALSVRPKAFELRLKKADQMSQPPARLRGIVVVNGQFAHIIDTPLRVTSAK